MYASRSRRQPVAEFVLYGTPVPQPRPRISTRGGFAKQYTPSDHPIVEYRKGIAAMAKHAIGKRLAGRNRVRIEVWAVFQRPRSHLNSKGLPREKAPATPRPDVDNVLKAVMDAITTSGAWEDDVVSCDGRCRKRYVGAAIESHTVVIVW